MENGKRITIISAPKDHGFKHFAEAKKWRVKTTVKRYNDSTIKSKAYSYEVKEIELLDGTNGENASLPRTSNNSITAAKLLQNV